MGRCTCSMHRHTTKAIVDGACLHWLASSQERSPRTAGAITSIMDSCHSLPPPAISLCSVPLLHTVVFWQTWKRIHPTGGGGGWLLPQ